MGQNESKRSFPSVAGISAGGFDHDRRLRGEVERRPGSHAAGTAPEAPHSSWESAWIDLGGEG
jgi:hypothetical protein